MNRERPFKILVSLYFSRQQAHFAYKRCTSPHRTRGRLTGILVANVLSTAACAMASTSDREQSSLSFASKAQKATRKNYAREEKVRVIVFTKKTEKICTRLVSVLT